MVPANDIPECLSVLKPGISNLRNLHDLLEIYEVIRYSVVVSNDAILIEAALSITLFRKIVDVDVVKLWVLEKPFELFSFVECLWIWNPVRSHVQTVKIVSLGFDSV